MILLNAIYIIILLILFITIPEAWQMYLDPAKFDANNKLIQKTEAKIFCK